MNTKASSCQSYLCALVPGGAAGGTEAASESSPLSQPGASARSSGLCKDRAHGAPGSARCRGGSQSGTFLMYQATPPHPMPQHACLTPAPLPTDPENSPKLLLTRELVSAEGRQTEPFQPQKWEEAGHNPHQPCSHLDTSTLQPTPLPRPEGAAFRTRKHQSFRDACAPCHIMTYAVDHRKCKHTVIMFIFKKGTRSRL